MLQYCGYAALCAVATCGGDAGDLACKLQCYSQSGDFIAIPVAVLWSRWRPVVVLWSSWRSVVACRGHTGNPLQCCGQADDLLLNVEVALATYLQCCGQADDLFYHVEVTLATCCCAVVKLVMCCSMSRSCCQPVSVLSSG